MSSLAQRLDNIHVRVKAPGAEIFAELHHRSEVDISFGPGIYDWLAERHLERYLASAAKLLYVGWTRACREALGDSIVQHSAAEETQTDRNYLDARGRLVATGRSADGRVTVTIKGVVHEVTVRIADGTIRALNQREFADRVHEAVAALAEDHLEKIRELKLRFYE
jgi:hypothetical protein